MQHSDTLQFKTLCIKRQDNVVLLKETFEVHVITVYKELKNVLYGGLKLHLKGKCLEFLRKCSNQGNIVLIHI